MYKIQNRGKNLNWSCFFYGSFSDVIKIENTKQQQQQW
jgi:hypothetical protein